MFKKVINFSPNRRFIIPSICFSKVNMSNLANVENVQDKLPRNLFQCGTNPYNKYDIGFNATMTQPSVTQFLLRNMELKEGFKCLDIGSGSGYLSACMALLVGHKGKVVSIEHIPEIAQFAKQANKSLGLNNVEVIIGEGRKGYTKNDMNFDFINIGGSVREVNQNIFNNLANGGAMIVTIGSGYNDQMTVKYTKDKHGNVDKQILTDQFAFAPLIDKEYQLSKKYLANIFNAEKMEIK